jgi:FkbM family methyltransferase
MNMSTPIKFAIQRGLRRFGWEIKRFQLSEMEQLNRFLTLHRVATVLDVGANIGQFATTLRQVGFQGRIVSFEPQSKAHSSLVHEASSDPLWHVAPRCAIGAETGEIEINISNNSVSSSVLPILEAHVTSWPDSRYVATEKASVIRLDDFPLTKENEPTFLKVDTQGFEQQVLDGAPKLLQSLVGVQLEMSLAPLYEGQADFISLMNQMRKSGFDVWALNPGISNWKTGRLLQVDGTFIRAKIDPRDRTESRDQDI